MSELAAAVERVWPGRDVRVEVLGGGITNHNLKVEVDGEMFVLRVAGQGHGPARHRPRGRARGDRAAAALGIGPEVVAFVEPEGWLVTRFVAGEIPPLERMREPAMLARVAAALRAFHDGAPIAGSSTHSASWRIPGDGARAGRDDPGRVRVGARARDADRGEALRRRARPCHNDLLNANFLDDGERLCIVDWEYAGMGDRFFDLANFSINHELDEDARAACSRRTSARCAPRTHRRSS